MTTARWAAAALLVLSATPLAHSRRGAVGLSAPLIVGETFTLQSETLHETRRINVYLPAAYSASPAKLPVLYMPDGGMGEDFLHIAGLVQVSTGNGTMRPFVLVGIENTQRRRDLTGPTKNGEDKKIAPQVGGSAAFRRFIREELMPAIRSRYRTTGEAAIIGESLAGLFVVETLVLEPDLFDTYIAVDPSLWWNDADLIGQARTRLAGGLAHPKTLYLASSRDDVDKVTERLADTLRTTVPPNVTWRFEPMPGETHATIYHPAALAAVRRVFAPEGGHR
jgi:predicted alpha/beta superfamily hydrolase